MTRLVRLIACAGILVLAVVLWTCGSDHSVAPPGPATSLSFTAGPANVTAGVQIPALTVTALDANGHTATAFASAITVSVVAGSGPAGATLSGTTTVNASSGVARFTTLSIDKSGTGYSLQATASGLTPAATGAFGVVSGPATQLAFTTEPNGTKAGLVISPAVKVTALDALGNAVTGFTGTVTVAITPGTGTAGATLSGTTTIAGAAGIATFADLSIDKVGTANAGTGYTLSATASGLTAATSDPFDIKSGTATRVQFTSQPTATAAGAGFAPLVEVSALDSVGNVVTTFTGNVTVAIGTNPGGATLAGTKIVAAANGVATFPGISLDKVGSGYTLAATATGLTGATSAAFNVAASSAARLAFTTQPVTTTHGAPIVPVVHVTARDVYGNTATGFAGNVNIAIAQNPSGGVLSGTTTLAASQGVATFADLSIDNIGTSYRIAASAAGLTPDTSVAFDILASTAAKLVCVPQLINSVAGAAITPAVQIAAHDVGNQLVTSFTGNVALALTGGTAGATLSGTTPVAAVAGVATFSDLSVDKSGSGYFLTATSTGLQSTTCGTINVVSDTATTLAFTVQPTNAAPGVAINPQIEVTAHDAHGNVATGFSGTVTIAIANNPAGGVLSGSTSVAAVAGLAVFNNLLISKAGVGYTISASASGPASATSGSFDITTGAPSTLTFAVQPSNTTAGASISPAIEVAAKDSMGNLVTSFNGNVTLSVTAGTGSSLGATLSGTTTVVASSGIATFSNLSIARAATGYTLSATTSGLAGATSAPFNILHGPAAKLIYIFPPGTAQAGGGIPGVQVQILDALGNGVDTSLNVSIGIGTNPAGGTLTGTTTVLAASSMALFTTLSIDRVGVGYTLVASAPGLTSVTSPPFDVIPGNETALAFSVQPTGGAAGVAIAPAVRVTARDALGNTVTTFTGNVTVAIAANPAGGTLSGTTTVAAVAGVATFSNLNIDKAGIGYTLSASAASLITATSAAFTVGPGLATALAFAVEPTTATASANIAPAVKVTARDALGNAATGFNGNITVAIGTNPAGGTLGGTRTLAAVNGVATYQSLNINNTGSGYTLTASAAGLAGATSAAFNIIPSVGTQLFFTVQPPDPATAGTVLAPSIVVTARDASGQTATSFTGNVTLAIAAGTGVPGATLSGTKTVAATAGVATFGNLSIDKASIYKLTAAASGLTGATSAFFTINPGAATQLSFTLQPSTTTVATAITPKVEVTARDAQGNTASSFTGNVAVAIATNPGSGTLGGTASVAAVNGVASFSNLTISQAGVGYTLSAAAAGLTGASSGSFDITAARATQLGFSVQPSAATAGQSINPAVKVTARDATGNVATTFSGAVTLSISAGTGTAGSVLSGTVTVSAAAGVATFSNLSIDNSGTGYRLAAVAAGVSGTTSTPFTVNPGAAARVTFTVHPGSATAATIIPGSTGPTIQATVRDALGNPVKTFNGNITVSILTNPAGGVLSGTATVATAQGVANFNDLTIDKASAGYRLGISAAGLAPDTSNAFSITPGAATSLLFTVQPSNANAGVSITPAIRVAAFDAQGNQATGFTGNVTLAIANNPSGGVLSGTTTVAAANGVASFSGLSISLAGIGYTLKATAAGVTQATSAAFNIN